STARGSTTTRRTSRSHRISALQSNSDAPEVAGALPALADIEAAARRLSGRAQRTPLLSYAELARRLGARVFIKPECLQVTGSFKFRGAYNKIKSALDA